MDRRCDQTKHETTRRLRGGPENGANLPLASVLVELATRRAPGLTLAISSKKPHRLHRKSWNACHSRDRGILGEEFIKECNDLRHKVV